MKNFLRNFLSIFIISIILVFVGNNSSLAINNPNNINKDNIFKVGFYEYYPYYFINDDLEHDGYYHDLMELLSRKLNIEYEYVDLKIEECVDNLRNNNIDLLFGVSKDSDKAKHLLFSDNSIATEPMSLYTNINNLEYWNLNSLNGLKLGYINNESNHDWILNLLTDRNVSVTLIEANTYDELENLLINKEVDVIPQLSISEALDEYNKIFDFSIGKIYLATSNTNKVLMDEINTLFNNSSNNLFNPFKTLHSKYFDYNNKLYKSVYLLLFVIIAPLVLIVVYIIYKYFYKRRVLSTKQNKILNNLKNNNYMLYYQPIVDPKSHSVKGFEGLLRLNENGKVLSPYFFLKEIEDADMMSTVSLWLVENAIKNFNVIKDFDVVKDKDFYISVNLSFKEIEDDNFVNSISELLLKSNLNPKSICLEIVEKFGVNDLAQIQKSIDKLKNIGFYVAIDDFGVEYSNLDILEKIDCDIIKLDKFFIDDIETSFTRKEIVNFISSICNHRNKILISEGVETINQKNIIKNIYNNKFYIQGYFYSKPLSINDLKNFNL